MGWRVGGLLGCLVMCGMEAVGGGFCVSMSNMCGC